MEFNANDDYHRHAFYALMFSCEACDALLGSPSERDVEIAERAKKDGWYVPPANDSKDFPAWCPACAGRLGLSRQDSQPHKSNDA
jgi:hypothetical protein